MSDGCFAIVDDRLLHSVCVGLFDPRLSSWHQPSNCSYGWNDHTGSEDQLEDWMY